MQNPTQNGLNNKTMYCLTWQEFEGRTVSVLVQSVAQQCHQDPGSSPLSALPTSACSSQANSPHGLKMAVPDATYRHNTVAEKRLFITTGDTFLYSTRRNFPRGPSEHTVIVIGQNFVTCPCLKQSLMRRLGPLI